MNEKGDRILQFSVFVSVLL